MEVVFVYFDDNICGFFFVGFVVEIVVWFDFFFGFGVWVCLFGCVVFGCVIFDCLYCYG